MVYSENFQGGFIQWHMVVIWIWCALFVTSQYDVIFMFQTNVLAKFVDIICIFFYVHSTHFMCHCTKYKLLALQVRMSEENKLNATTQQYITAKIPGCALKQGSKTHSSLINASEQFQLQNEAALMSCRIRAVEYGKRAAGLAGAHPDLQDRILLNCTKIENAHKVRKNTSDFLFFIEVQQILVFLFPCWDIINAWMLLF